MRYAGASRRDLVDALHGAVSLYERASAIQSYADLPYNHHELTLVWVSSERLLPSPNVIIVNDLPVREFLAWMHTYVPTVRPLTAFCRVIGRDQVERLERERPNGWAEPLAAGAAGIVAAECLGSSPYSDLRDSMNCSFSLPIARSLLAGYSAEELRGLSSVWLKTRVGVQQEQGRRVVAEFGEVWMAVARLFAESVQSNFTFWAASPPPSGTSRFLINALHGTSQSLHTFISSEYLQGASFDHDFNREERVRAVEHYAQHLRSTDVPKSDASMMLGYLIDAIAPGTLAHIGVAAPLRAEFSQLLPWYGFFAGVSMKTSRGGLGGTWLHIQKQLAAEECQAAVTRADIGAAELIMLLPVERLKRVLNGVIGDELLVELAPGIYSTVKLEGAFVSAVKHVHRDTERDDALIQMEEGLRNVNAAYHKLAGDKRPRVKTATRKRQP